MSDDLWFPQADLEYQEWEQDCKDYPDIDISPRTAGYAMREMLQRAEPHMLLGKFGQKSKNNFVGSRSTGKTIKFRRYHSDKEPFGKTEVSCEDTDGTTYPVALRRIEV